MEATKLKSTEQSWQRQLVRFAPYIIIGVISIPLPPFLPLYVQSLMTKLFIFAIFAISCDILIGYTGLITFGHAAYFGAGSYTVALLMLHYNINNLWVSAPLGILIAALIAAVFGTIALRVTGFYFIFVTFALAQLLFSIAWKWDWLATPGVEGIVGIPRPSIGLPWFTWNPTFFYYFIVLVFVICFFILYRVVKSPFGYALQGIRESEPRMRVFGYNTWLYKYIAFVVGGAFAGLAGVLYAYHNGSVVPDYLGATISAWAVLMVILGGAGTLYGPVVGAVVLVPLEFYSGIFTPERWPLILGGAYVLTMMYARLGIGVYLSRLWKKVVYQHGSIKS